ncbi:MAG: hypothetical protein EON47_14550 [Acetobacteraceae bacterium]|nr:MAG: hypothetical protein EON47_14550 [Acetobacteraceae bacterium]
MSKPTLEAAFPARPLTLKAPIAWVRSVFLAIGAIILAGGFGWFATAEVVPTLLQDYAVREGAAPIRGRIESGRCRSRWALFQDCEMVLIAASQMKGGAPLRQKVDYLFVEPHMGDYSVQVMADPDRPDWLTTDMGQDHLVNRMLTLAGFALGMLLIIFGGLISMRRGWRARSAMRALSGQRLAPVPLRLLRRDQNGWQLVPMAGGTPMVWPLPAKAEPLWLDATQAVALGVGVPGQAPFPLDHEMTWADFSPAEREQLRAALQPPASSPVAP